MTSKEMAEVRQMQEEMAAAVIVRWLDGEDVSEFLLQKAIERLNR